MTQSSRENMKLSDAGEFGLIERLAEISRETLAPGVRGAGDDCAAIPAGDSFLVVTTDVMVEERHFRWDFTSAFDLGWKLLAVNLSDIAAAGAKPVAAVITLQLRGGMETAIVEEIYRGIAALAKQSGVSIAGGDTTSSPVVALGATAFGLADKPLGRSGARPGDDLWISGDIGSGGLGLALAKREVDAADFPDAGRAAREKYCRPVPRTELGALLGASGFVSAAIDISDGLIQDAGHVARRSGARLEIELNRVPFGPSSARNWSPLRAATSGDDYELLFSAPASARAELEALHHPLSRIGSVLEPGGEPDVLLKNGFGVSEPAASALQRAGIPAGGFDHFRSDTSVRR